MPFDFSEDELQQAIDAGERRVAARKQAQRKQTRRITALVAIVVVAVPVGVAAFIASKRVPGTPRFVVTWPKFKTPQSMESGQLVLAREGQPFDVSISESPKWDVSWSANGLQNTGETFSWAPQATGNLLQARCRAKNTDWTAYFSAVVPTRDLSLGAVLPDTTEGYARSVSLSGEKSVWVYPHILATGNVGWDERTLPALTQVADIVPEAALADKLDTVSEKPAPALWQIVSDFDGGVGAPAQDGGTYASLHGDSLDTTLPRVGARLVQIIPDASIKWVLRFDKDLPEGIVRLSFDGKRERRAWIKRKGDSAGTPMTGWETGDWKGTVPLELPTPTPTSRQ